MKSCSWRQLRSLALDILCKSIVNVVGCVSYESGRRNVKLDKMTSGDHLPPKRRDPEMNLWVSGHEASPVVLMLGGKS